MSLLKFEKSLKNKLFVYKIIVLKDDYFSFKNSLEEFK